MASVGDARWGAGVIHERDLSTAAAHVAYYALVSLVPAVALAAVVAGLVGALFPIYYVLPGRPVTLAEAAPKTLLATVG